MKAVWIGFFVLLFLCFVWYSHTHTYAEGFRDRAPTQFGPVPTSAQSSSIPTDTPGASTNNPSRSLPQTRDIQALRDELENFDKLYQTTPTVNLLDTQRLKITTTENMSRDIRPQIGDWIANPANAKMTVSDVAALRKTLAESIRILRNTPASTNRVRTTKSAAPAKRAVNAATTVARTPHTVSLASLRSLRDRIQSELQTLQQYRSTSPTILQRMSQLERLMADVKNYIGSVERKSIQIEDVPIFQEDADSFIRSMNNLSKPLPTLVHPNPTPSSSKPAPPTLPTKTPMDTIQPMLEMAKHLKWHFNIDIDYDPEIVQRERILERVEAIEKHLTDMMIREKPLSPQMFLLYTKELSVLQTMLETKTQTQTHPHWHTQKQKQKQKQRSPTHEWNVEYPSRENLDHAQGKHCGPNKGQFPDGEDTANVYVRPGVIMTLEDIQNRGSLAAFDPSSVGGSDYKKRALDICRQIKGADLGTPSSFGCIDDPHIVSDTYSWKGNYEMVCRRLGDTWGSWYPEMFGCPKVDPTAKYA